MSLKLLKILTDVFNKDSSVEPNFNHRSNYQYNNDRNNFRPTTLYNNNYYNSSNRSASVNKVSVTAWKANLGFESSGDEDVLHPLAMRVVVHKLSDDESD